MASYMDFPIPIDEIATKSYVDDKVGQQVSVKIGMMEEYFNKKFERIEENFEMQNERMDRFELETGQRFKAVNDRLDTVVIDLGNLENKFDVVISEIRSLREKIEK